MTGVRIIHLGEIARFRYGKMPETEKILVDDATGGFPIFTGYRIAGRYSEFNIETPKLIVVCRGVGGTGDVKITPTKCWLTNLSIVFELVEEFADIHYLYYFFAAYSLRFLDTGSAQSQITITDLQRLKIPLPNLITQKKIALILSAYDDLIENNQRRIALLEKMTEEIYREWFVRLRFPGHEKVKIIKGVPEGWRVAELKELAVVNPSSISLRDKPEVMLYVDISSVSTNQIEETTTYAYSQAPGRARRRVKHGDVIWSSVRPANRAYCLIYEPPDNLIVSTGFAVIRPKTATPFSFLFFAVTSNSFVDQMTTVAKGAAYPATSFDDFEKAKLLVPSDDLLKSFHEKVEPLFRQKNLFQQQCERLKHTRNLLLPRLISGKLSVEHLDIRFPPGMEELASA